MRVREPVQGRLTVQRSRFHATLAPADSAEAAAELVARRTTGKLRKARHHCWAWRHTRADGTVEAQCRDDGEVGHPGRVLLAVLDRYELEGVLVVSRIFGGVKLGVGGVARAFRQAGEAVAEQARTVHPGSG
jgi:putative IMPACT (imprinted ancient) family translation regulator